ncbi:hypothetical protein V6Z11_D11G279600 [Gossypium hirsutum]
MTEYTTTNCKEVLGYKKPMDLCKKGRKFLYRNKKGNIQKNTFEGRILFYFSLFFYCLFFKLFWFFSFYFLKTKHEKGEGRRTYRREIRWALSLAVIWSEKGGNWNGRGGVLRGVAAHHKNGRRELIFGF